MKSCELQFQLATGLLVPSCRRLVLAFHFKQRKRELLFVYMFKFNLCSLCVCFFLSPLSSYFPTLIMSCCIAIYQHFSFYFWVLNRPFHLNLKYQQQGMFSQGGPRILRSQSAYIQIRSWGFTVKNLIKVGKNYIWSNLLFKPNSLILPLGRLSNLFCFGLPWGIILQGLLK